MIISKLHKTKEVLSLVEKKIVDFAKSRNINYYGSYNPNFMNLKPNEFYDATHLKDVTSYKVLKFKNSGS
jgi:hypothetical protein